MAIITTTTIWLLPKNVNQIIGWLSAPLFCCATPPPPPSTPLCTAPQWSNEPPRYANHPDASTRPMERQLGRQQRHSSWRPINSNGREIQNNFESLKVGRTLLIGGFVHDSLLGAMATKKSPFPPNRVERLNGRKSTNRRICPPNHLGSNCDEIITISDV